MILPNLHRIAKVTLSFVLAFMLFIRLFIVDVSALSAAPIFGEALVEVFSTLLVGSGLYTSEEVSDMSWAEAEYAIDSGISSGAINPLEIVGDVTVDGITTQMNFIEWLATINKTSYSVVTSDTFGTITDTALKFALQNSLPGAIGSWISTLEADDVISSSVDLNGYGAKVVCYYKALGVDYYIYYCDYVVLANEIECICYSSTNCYMELYNDQGVLTNTIPLEPVTGITYSSNFIYSHYGDVRTLDGDIVDTTTETEVGETEDGEDVTLEDIQSGAVSADDVTLDYDKFNDEAIIDLLQQILAELERVPIVEDTADNTIAEDFAQELDGSIALELEDINALTLPTGIATVFPFCLPFDFAYGLELLASKPIAPKFEIPFEIPAFGLYPGTSEVITLDLAEYSKYFDVGRWVQCIIFAIGLCFISFKIVKGVH